MKTVRLAITAEQRSLLVEAVLCKIADLDSRLASLLAIEENRRGSYDDGRLKPGPNAAAYDHKLAGHIRDVQSAIAEFRELRAAIVA